MKQPRIEEVYVHSIYAVGERRPIDSVTVDRLATSIEKIGLQHPITVRYDPTFVGPDMDPERDEPGGHILIAGLHRLEAVKLLGWKEVNCINVEDWDERTARLWEIAENLHRADLTVQQRADQIAEWIRLTEEGISAQNAPKIKTGRGRPEGGINAAARELGLERTEAQRALKIADIDPAAKEAADAAGLNKQSMLLKIAAKPKDQQLAAVHEMATRPKPEPEHPPAEPDEKTKWLEAGALWWAAGHIEWRNEFIERNVK